MLVDSLESGCLLFETDRGLVRAELSFRQRIYLLWTFRHFNHLSMKLLNSRQRDLVNRLFSRNSGVIAEADQELSVIGVVEEFVPAAGRNDVGLFDAATPTQNERAPEVLEIPQACFANSSDPKLPAEPLWEWTTMARSRLAAAIGWACLCILFVMAWRRIQDMPISQAQTSHNLEQVNAAISAPASPSTISSVNPDTSSVMGSTPAGRAAEVQTVDLRTANARTVNARTVNARTADARTVNARTVNARTVNVHEVSGRTVEKKNESPLSPAASVRSSRPSSEEASAPHKTASSPGLDASAQESAIEASRSPLHFVYPDHQNIRTRSVVALAAQVEPDGTVRSVRVISGKRSLAAAAVRAVRQWHYKPYFKDGQAVATETNIVISFIANDKISMSFPPSIPAAR